MKKIIDFIADEFLLCLFVILLVILSCFEPDKIRQYPFFVDWNTIAALTGLLIITTGFKQSGYFDLFAKRMLSRLKTERKIAFFLILFSAILSCFVTNDIALFIVVPLTLSLRKLTGNDVSKIVIFEAIAVNAGSALTPIGNPQNLYLWHRWNISFFSFIAFLFPAVICLLLILFFFVFVAFPNTKITNVFVNSSNKSKDDKKDIAKADDNINVRKTLFSVSFVALIVYVISLELDFANLLLPVICIFYLFFYRRILLNVDWLLLFMFIIMFIDFHLIANIPFVNMAIEQINMQSSRDVFLFSGAISQLISNVPASIFVSKFSDNWLAIAYGVNVGGNGIVIASLANVIALRMLKNKKAWLTFHKYSIPYFLITIILTYCIIRLFF